MRFFEGDIKTFIFHSIKWNCLISKKYFDTKMISIIFLYQKKYKWSLKISIKIWASKVIDLYTNLLNKINNLDQIIFLIFYRVSLQLTRCTVQQRYWQKNTIGLHCWISHSKVILNSRCRGVQRKYRKCTHMFNIQQKWCADIGWTCKSRRWWVTQTNRFSFLMV